MKYCELKPHELHLGHGNVIDMSDVYNHRSLDDGWQMREDNSGEYRDTLYYSYDAHRVLVLIGEGYAELFEIESFCDNNSLESFKYFFRMRRNY